MEETGRVEVSYHLSLYDEALCNLLNRISRVTGAKFITLFQCL
jgi:hypothetical protein